MGRRSHSQTLHLWANGDYVGRWAVKANGESELQYDAAWRLSERGRPISLSMPFNLGNEPIRAPVLRTTSRVCCYSRCSPSCSNRSRPQQTCAH